MAKSTERVLLKGKFKYMKHLRPDPKYPDKWSTLIYPDEESLAKIKELKKQGVQNHLKMDDDGWYINFARPIKRTWLGKEEAMTAPRVIDKSGAPVMQFVGNGSDGILELDVYPHKTDRPGVYKKAARWYGARIDNLIPYDPDPDYSDEEKAELKALREEPEQLF